MWGAQSDERMGLLFTIAAGPRQHSHSRVRVPRDSLSYFIVSDSRLPQPGGPGPHIYITQKQGDPFPRLLRLAGLRWRYTKPPPHRSCRSVGAQMHRQADHKDSAAIRASSHRLCDLGFESYTRYGRNSAFLLRVFIGKALR
jgi:hypothetical protein